MNMKNEDSTAKRIGQESGRGTGQEPGSERREEAEKGTEQEPGSGRREEAEKGTGQEPGSGKREEAEKGTGQEPGSGRREEAEKGTGQEPGSENAFIIEGKAQQDCIGKMDDRQDTPYSQIYQPRTAVRAAVQPEQMAERFRVLGLPSLLYAVVYTVCMFQNSSGITMPVWIAAVLVYACTMMRCLNAAAGVQTSVKFFGSLKKGSMAYIVIMLLLGIASVLTDNSFILFFNYAGFFIILIAFLLHNFYDDSRWGFEKSLVEIAAACLGAVGCLPAPFSDGLACCRERKVQGNKAVRAALAGVAAAVPGLLVLGVCLMSADAVFDSIVVERFSGFRLSVRALRCAVMLMFGFFSSYCGMCFLALHSRDMQIKDHRQFEPAAAMTFTGMIAVLYVVFCGIQVIYLFAGIGELPEGMTYAQYARSGFFQLLFVCLVNLCLVLLVKKYFSRHKVLDSILLVICACTFIMIGSSAYRMLLYIGTYKLTFLRVCVLAALAVLALLMAGVALMIIRAGFPLFRYSVAVVSTVYLAFAFSHVDYFIASYNLSHVDYAAIVRSLERDEAYAGHIDWWYLSAMSLDAAPAVADFYENAPEELRQRLDQSAALAEKLAAGRPGENDSLENNLYNEEPVEVRWYGIYIYRVSQVKRDMGLRNFNVSRFMGVQRLSGF